MYTQQWLDKSFVNSFFRWAERMSIEFELSNPWAPFEYEDFEVRMHHSDWKKFEEHFQAQGCKVKKMFRQKEIQYVPIYSMAPNSLRYMV